MPTAIDPVAAPTTSSSTTTTKKPDALGKDAFLKLLVAQMKYQDPMSPADGNAFIAQSSQLAMVEKLEDLASSNAQMLAAQRSQTAAALLHQNVAWTEDGADQTGVVDSVRLTADGPLLVIGSKTVPLSVVTSLGAAVPASSPTPSPQED